ncbi:MAG TPA: Cof-type HAD-IIB family hydrolase [Candidatus Wallbacteria bacterium]|nr:Cof-type HAD-IIB family hydrolase [Candidatus Wallbacteria bacterium]
MRSETNTNEFQEKKDKIKFIAIDMDGTLLPENKKITERTLRTLKNISARGYELCICSGRSFNGVYKYEQIRDLISYYICFEGGYIVDNMRKDSPAIINKTIVPRDELFAVIETVLKHGAMLALLCDTYGYCVNCPDEIMESVSIWGAIPVKCSEISVKEKALRDEAFIILIYGDELQIDKITADMPRVVLDSFDIIKAFLDFNGLHHLVIKAPDINKWKGIEKVLKVKGLEGGNAMAFGDWHNDLEMVKNAGIGVAMKNAEDEIMSVAYTKTDFDNNNDGVARFLELHFLNGSN